MVLSIIACASAVAFVALSPGESATPIVAIESSASETNQALPTTDGIRVEISGAVASPTVVQLPEGARLIDAIEAVGGWGERVDPVRVEAGLAFACAYDKPGGFIGREAVLAREAEGPLTRRLVQVLVEDPAALLYHAEVIHRDGRAIGYVRAASYGHTLGGAVGLAMLEPGCTVDEAYLASGQYEVDIAGVRYPVRVSLKPLYDPSNRRIRA